MPTTFTVEEDYQDSRFDKWFKNNVLDIPHSLIEKFIRLNKVKVNKKRTQKHKSEQEIQKNVVVLRDMTLGEQTELTFEDAVTKMREVEKA